MNIEEEVLSKITPKDDENSRINEVVEKVQRKILDVAKSMKIEIEPKLVGSVAKDTHLTDPDIDIFVIFPTSTKREDLESYGLTIGTKILDESEKRYAEHPYVIGKYNGLTVEIVPCYNIQDSSQKMSAVDRTPFHTSYIVEHIKKEQKDQIRLLKQFQKGIGVYGAESEIEGFSGYLCELLVLHYGDFKNIIANAKDWKKGMIITFNDGDYARFNETLIVVDPVDSNRNVASALSQENFAIFIHACKEYNAKPRIEFFFPNDTVPKTLEELEEIIKIRGTTLLGIVFEAPRTLSDILHSQLRKSMRGIVKFLENYDFYLIAWDYFVDGEILLLFEFEVFSIAPIKLHRGPPVGHPNAPDFFKKWIDSPKLISGPFIKDSNWYVDIKREYRNPKELIESKLYTLGLGGHINKALKNGYTILVGLNILDERYSSWLTMFFEKKFRWEY